MILPGDPHALASSAGGGLDHDGVSDFMGCAWKDGAELVDGDRQAHTDFDGVLFVLDDAIKAGDRVDASLLGNNLAFNLVAHLGHGRDGGPNKGDAMLIEGLAKFKVFRKKAVAGMDGLGAGTLDGGEDGLNVEIALGRRSGALGMGEGLVAA